MESDIKLVDLTKENLNTVKEAIKIASSLGPTGFKFFVSKNFIRHGLVVTKIVPLSGDAPPKSQLLMRFTDLKNLKKAVDFAKRVLVNDGEALVEERTEPVIHATAAVEEMTTDALSLETETTEVETSIPEDSSSTETSKKRGRKKASVAEDTGTEADLVAQEESE